jgi:hypothetical protein
MTVNAGNLNWQAMSSITIIIIIIIIIIMAAMKYVCLLLALQSPVGHGHLIQEVSS